MGRYEKKTNDRTESKSRIAKAIEKYQISYDDKKKSFPPESLAKLEVDLGKYGANIRGERIAVGFGIEKCANEIGTTAATLSKIENGQLKKLNYDFLYLLCVLFKCTPHYLLGMVNEKNKSIDADKTVLSSPIRYSEPIAAYLMNELDTMDLIDNAYTQDPAMCELLLYLLRSKNPLIYDRIKSALRGICALYLKDSEYAEVKDY